MRRRRSAKISNCFSSRNASLLLIGEIAVVVLLLLLILLLSLLLLLFYCCCFVVVVVVVAVLLFLLLFLLLLLDENVNILLSIQSHRGPEGFHCFCCCVVVVLVFCCCCNICSQYILRYPNFRPNSQGSSATTGTLYPALVSLTISFTLREIVLSSYLSQFIIISRNTLCDELDFYCLVIHSYIVAMPIVGGHWHNSNQLGVIHCNALVCQIV